MHTTYNKVLCDVHSRFIIEYWRQLGLVGLYQCNCSVSGPVCTRISEHLWWDTIPAGNQQSR